MKIMLNDLLRLENLENVKIRLNKDNPHAPDFDPIKLFKEDKNELLYGQFWNYAKKKSFRKGDVAIGLARIKGDEWLLFDISEITEDLNKRNAVGYKHKTISKYEKYFGRIIVKYHNKSQNLVRTGKLMNDLEVYKILPDIFDDDDFPGYENVYVSWKDLKRLIDKKTWKTALENQKGVYLITDIKTGKFYVGSAYGENMILGRWQSYIKTGHGGNEGLIELIKEEGFEYVQKNFKYSILDIYKSKTDDNVIIGRESKWKEMLLSKTFGYNKN